MTHHGVGGSPSSQTGVVVIAAIGRFFIRRWDDRVMSPFCLLAYRMGCWHACQPGRITGLALDVAWRACRLIARHIGIRQLSSPPTSCLARELWCRSERCCAPREHVRRGPAAVSTFATISLGISFAPLGRPRSHSSDISAAVSAPDGSLTMPTLPGVVPRQAAAVGHGVFDLRGSCSPCSLGAPAAHAARYRNGTCSDFTFEFEFEFAIEFECEMRVAGSPSRTTTASKRGARRTSHCFIGLNNTFLACDPFRQSLRAYSNFDGLRKLDLRTMAVASTRHEASAAFRTILRAVNDVSATSLR